MTTQVSMGSSLVMRLVLERLDVHDRALHGRFVCKDAYEHLRRPRHWTVRLSQPLPPSAGDALWQTHLRRAFDGLTFRAKTQSLKAAAASGSEANLELAWGLLRPCLFPELLLPRDFSRFRLRALHAVAITDPGSAAIASGHAHLLPWLIQNCCPLDPGEVLNAAATHCDMEGMLQTWQLLGGGSRPPDHKFWREEMARAAGRSDTAAVAKLSWLLSPPEGTETQQEQEEQEEEQQQEQQELLLSAAKGAAVRGRLPVLQWLLGEGLDAGGNLRRWHRTLAAVLLHRHVAVADWLVDVAGCPLPQQEQRWELEFIWMYAGWSGSMQPISWLLGRGVPLQEAAILGAGHSGNLEAVQLLHARYGLPLTAELFTYAAESRSMPTATWLLQMGCPMGPEAYRRAALQGDADMVLWLAQTAMCPWNEGTASSVISMWREGAESSSSLLPTVRALVEAGCPQGGVQGQGPAGGGGMQRHGSAALDAAVRRGHLPLAHYLHEELGVGFGPNTLAEAAQGGCEPVLEWLVGAGCGPGTGYPYVKAADHGDLATLRCLHRMGVPLGDAGWWRQLNAFSVPLAAVRWLVERGAPWDEEGARTSFFMRGATTALVTKSRCRGLRHAWLSALQQCDKRKGGGATGCTSPGTRVGLGARG